MPGNDIKDYEDLQSGGWAGKVGRERGSGGYQQAQAQGPGEGHSNFSPLCACLQMTAKTLQVSISGHKSILTSK